MLRASSKLSGVIGIEEVWQGVSQLLFLDELCQNEEESLESFRRIYPDIRETVLRNRPLINITAEDKDIDDAIKVLDRSLMADSIQGGDPATIDPPAIAAGEKVEALIASSGVGYVARALKGAGVGTPEYAAESVLAHLLSTGFLWESIRMRGGAYGAFASSQGMERVFSFGTYRDPNIMSSFAAFSEALEAVEKGEVSIDDVERSIIGTVGRDIRPMSPGAKGYTSLLRRMTGVSDEMRQQHRDWVLSVDKDKLISAARRLLDSVSTSASVVMSGREAVQRAGDEWGELGRNTTELPG